MTSAADQKPAQASAKPADPAPPKPTPRQAAIAALVIKQSLLQPLMSVLSKRINGSTRDVLIYSALIDLRVELQAIALRLPYLDRGESFTAPTPKQMMDLKNAAAALRTLLDNPASETTDLIKAGNALLACYGADASNG